MIHNNHASSVALTLLQTLSDHEDTVWSIAWHPKYPTLFASCGSDKTLKLFQYDSNRNSFQCIDNYEGNHNRTIRRVAWSLPNGNALACSSFDGTASVWVLSKNKLGNVQQQQQFPNIVNNNIVNKNQGNLSYNVLKCVSTLEGHENEVKAVAWHNSKNKDEMDGTLLATCGRDKTVWIWDAIDQITFNDFDCISVCSGHTQDVKYVLFHPNSSYPLLFSTSYDDTIRVWKEVEDGEWLCVNILRGHSGTVWCLAFEPIYQNEVQYLVSVGEEIILWKEEKLSNDDDMQDEELSNLKYTQLQLINDVHERTIYFVDWCTYQHPTNNNEIVSLVAIVSGDNSISIFEFSRSEEKLKLLTKVEKAHDSDINACCWNPHFFGLLSTCSDDGTIKLWKFVY
ncbi:hypothetical protein ABK040_006721 [Willaertia magna]